MRCGGRTLIYLTLNGVVPSKNFLVSSMLDYNIQRNRFWSISVVAKDLREGMIFVVITNL